MIDFVKANSRIYFDANILIYLIERTDALQRKIVQILDLVEKTGGSLHFSNIGVAECFYGAYKHDSEALLQQY